MEKINLFQVPSFKYGFLPRYPRIQILHELIWKLVYGNGTNQKMSSTVENSQVEGNFSENDECLKNLKPMEKVLDEYGKPLQGWFRFCDVFSVMPLVIICKTVDITDEVGVGNLVIYYLYYSFNSGLKIMAGRWTMSSQNHGNLSSSKLHLLFMLTDHALYHSSTNSQIHTCKSWFFLSFCKNKNRKLHND